MTAASLIRCPSCGATNRLPVDAIAQGKKAVCGRCKTPLAAVDGRKVFDYCTTIFPVICV
jgi:uncharacterized paraquat-inducible protein A